MKNYTKTNIDRAWFSRLLWHPARKRSWSILTTLEPARGTQHGRQTTSDHAHSATVSHCRQSACLAVHSATLWGHCDGYTLTSAHSYKLTLCCPFWLAYVSMKTPRPEKKSRLPNTRPSNIDTCIDMYRYIHIHIHIHIYIYHSFVSILLCDNSLHSNDTVC